MPPGGQARFPRFFPSGEILSDEAAKLGSFGESLQAYGQELMATLMTLLISGAWFVNRMICRGGSNRCRRGKSPLEPS